MRPILFSLTNPIHSLKGDAKIINSRLAQLRLLGYKPALIIISPSLLSLSSVRIRSLDESTYIYSIPLFTLLKSFALILFSPRLCHYPLQSALSLAVTKTPNLLSLIKSLSDEPFFHFFHLRSIWLLHYLTTGTPSLFELIDSYTNNYRRRLLLTPWYKRPFLYFELQRIEYTEAHLPFLPHLTYSVVSEVDSTLIQSHSQSPISVLPQGIESVPFSPLCPGPSHPLKVVFFGNLSYFPNKLAISFLINFVRKYPINDSSIFKLTIAGRGLSPRTKRILTDLGISFQSPVVNMKSFVQSHHLSVAPLFSGSGLQSKILESMSWSRPVLITPLPYSSLETPHLTSSLLFDDVDSLYSLILRIYNDTSLLQQASLKDFRYFENTYSNDVTTQKLSDLYSLPTV